MMDTLDTAWAKAWVDASAAVIEKNRIDLIELDRVIGDGDHGENLDRGFRAVKEKVAAAEAATVADVLKVVAKTLMSTVGGAAGPLYGTAYLRAAGAAQSAQVDADAVAAMIEAALGGLVARGKAEVGDKTMVDAWDAAAKAARAAAGEGAGAAETLAAAASAAAEAAEGTIGMQARKGRASYLGERSIGHKDPGAQSTALLLQAAADTAREAR